MSNFSEILAKVGEVNEDLDQGDELTRFFGALKKFNGGKNINDSLKIRIEKFFDYKWKNDKLIAINDEHGEAMVTQLPFNVRDSLLCKFFFSKFLAKFSKFFKINKKGTLVSNNRLHYNWQDEQYRDFMTKILMSLEPRCEPKKTIMANELDEFNEITFIQKGSIVIGYEINNQKRYCIKYDDNAVIGAYECMFNKRSAFIYTALTEIEGLFIRKSILNELREDFDHISFCFRRNILLEYLMNIRIKVVVNKKKAIETLHSRYDQ